MVATLLMLAPASAFAVPPLMSIPGSGNVSARGAFNYTIPIKVPPGTVRMAPSLALTYSSENGDGFEGWGWTLSGLSAITRCPRTVSADGIHGGVNYDSPFNGGTNDRFCIDGQRLMLASGTYGTDGSTYSTQYQGFSKITAHGTAGNGPAWFELRAKNGTVYQFGNTVDSAVQATGKASIRKWLVNQITDTKTNYLKVTYTETNGEAYPIEIDYTGNTAASVAPYNSVQFLYASRSDVPLFWQGGSWWKFTKRLSHIKTFHGTSLVLDYQLGYEGGTTTAHSRLKTLAMCGADGSCLPTTTLGWQGGGMSTVNAPATNALAQGYGLLSGDFNADGVTDAFVLNPNCPAGGDIFVGSNAGSFTAGNFTASYSYTVKGTGNVAYSGPACFPAGSELAVSVGDTTADGRSKVMWVYDSWEQDQNGNWIDPFKVTNVLGNDGTNLSAQLTGYPNTPVFIPLYIAGDFNGDGRLDGYGQYPNTNLGYAYLSSVSNGTYTLGGDGGEPGLGPGTTLTPGDFDGDGCTDLLAQGATNEIYYFCLPATTTSTTGVNNWSGSTIVPGDFNGDGLTDLLVINSSGASIYLSTGTGLSSAYSVSAAYPATGAPDWSKYRIVAGDWNGDGKTDVALVLPSGGSQLIYQSMGTDFIQVGSAAHPGTSAIVADWNNDGADDLWLKGSSDGELLFTFLPETMTSIDNGVGGTTVIKYDRLNRNGSFYVKASNATYSTKDLDGAYYVVSEIDADDGMTGTHNVKYTYKGAKADATAPAPHGIPPWSLASAGFLTFSSITATDQKTGIATTTSFRADVPYVGFVSAQTVKSGSVVLWSITNTPASADQGGGSTFVYVQKSVVSRSDLDGTALPTVTTTYTPDAYGNMTTIAQTLSDGSSRTITNYYYNDTTNWVLGQPTSTAVRSVVGTSDLTRGFTFTPDPNGSGITKTIITQAGDTSCNAGTSSCTLTTTYGIDAFGHRNSVTLSGSDITSRTSSIQYDPNGEFPISMTDPLNHTTTIAYDPLFGGPKQVTDPNSVISSETYDSLGRPHIFTKPDGNKVVTIYTQCTGLPGIESCPPYATWDAIATPTRSDGVTQNGAISIAYYDSLGRVLASDVQGLRGAWIRTATQYDSTGNVAQMSRPYFLPAGAPVGGPVWITFQHDAIGRITQQSSPYQDPITGLVSSATTSWCYHGLTSSVTDNNLHITTSVQNAQGLVASVQQNAVTACSDSVTPTTSYTYDAFGNAINLTDNANHSIVNQFDILGRKVQSSAPDMGTWTYSYDQLNELTGQTDALGHNTTVRYDSLMRPTSRVEADLSGTWTYDDATSGYGIGKLNNSCISSPCSGGAYWHYFGYDPMGRVNKSTYKLDSTSYYYQASYNPDGRLDTLRYPSGFVAKYKYDGYGYLTEIDDNGSGSPLWTVGQRNSDLRLLQATAGNGIITTQNFDPYTGVLVGTCASSSSPCAGEIANLSYGWDPVGNLLSRGDTFQSMTETACYDAYNRLIHYAQDGSNCTSGTDRKSLTYTISIGDINKKTDVCNTASCYNYAENGAGIHALSSIGACTGGGCFTDAGIPSPTFQYDANGNMKCVVAAGVACDASHAARYMTWTSFNMMATIKQGTKSAELGYSAEHQRYRMCSPNCSNPTTKTLYIHDLATGGSTEFVTSNGASEWHDWIVSPEGQIVAERILPVGQQAHMYYMVNDHLGSIATITDSTGNIVERDSYDPWGKRRDPDGSDDMTCSLSSVITRGFTGHEMLDQFCLINMNGRIYDPIVAKFLSADDRVPDPLNLLSFQRYTYLNNNPMNGTDPTGHENGPSNFGGCFILCGSFEMESLQEWMAETLPNGGMGGGPYGPYGSEGPNGGGFDIVGSGMGGMFGGVPASTNDFGAGCYCLDASYSYVDPSTGIETVVVNLVWVPGIASGQPMTFMPSINSNPSTADQSKDEDSRDKSKDTRPLCPSGPGIDAARWSIRQGTNTEMVGGAVWGLGAAAQGAGGPLDPLADLATGAAVPTGKTLVATGITMQGAGAAYLAQNGMWGDAFNTTFLTVVDKFSPIPEFAQPYADVGADRGLTAIEDFFGLQLNSCRLP